MSESVFFTAISLLFGTILAIFVMKYGSAAYQARSRIKVDNTYRELAETATTAQVASAALLASIKSELSNVMTRLTALEKILKEVE
jgi:hypothetical protein